MILINAKQVIAYYPQAIRYGLLVILINAKPMLNKGLDLMGYGLLVILINAKLVRISFV